MCIKMYHLFIKIHLFIGFEGVGYEVNKMCTKVNDFFVDQQ